MRSEIRIGNKLVGEGRPVYVIAELGISAGQQLRISGPFAGDGLGLAARAGQRRKK